MEEFLGHFIQVKPGRVLNTKGEVVGTHSGAVFYTVGERHGFEVESKSPDAGAFFIVSKNLKENTITVSNNQPEIVSLSPDKVFIKSANWTSEPEPPIFARIRYRGEKVPVKLSLLDKRLCAEFKEPQRGLSSEQSIVFYSSDRPVGPNAGVCYGGGVMEIAS